MASGVTNTGKIRILEHAFRNTRDTAAFDTVGIWYMALSDSTATFSVTSTTFDTTSEIATGNGYTGGGDTIGRDTTDWDTLAIDTASNYGYIRLKDIVWTASGGNIPDTGLGASYAVLLGNDTAVGSRQIYAWFDLTQAREVGPGALLTLQDVEIRLT
jgi:hypothetical protein